ncbi:MAG: AI-2E family transporter [Oscillibacter sp.]|jgi:predicted PurR-regulated permease PerM|nr:AI-2E family transporter [Oscillibacter sp.]
MTDMKKDSRYWKVGLTVFLTVSAILLFYDTLFGSRAMVKFGVKLFNTLKPILFGAMIAYLLTPVINFFENKLFPESLKRAKLGGKLCSIGPRVVSLLLTWIAICVLAYLLLLFLIPELYRSIVQLFNSLETYYNTINNWINSLLEKNPAVEAWASGKIEAYYNDLVNVLSEKVLPQTQQIMTAVSGGIMTALIFFKNLIVGAIVSVYLLSTKERCAAHGRKLIYGLLNAKQTPWVFRGIHRMDAIFSGFVRGKLLDSLIIGVICFILSEALHFPYAPLVSVIIGVTNIIPFFGPFLGAIPSLFLILLVSPLKALYFLIFIIALQQVDGNIIGPKILGNTTGLSSLWVIIAILVGGSFFGIPGMFFGVPVCACFYSLLTFLVEQRLRKKNLPVTTDAYQTETPGETAENHSEIVNSEEK